MRFHGWKPSDSRNIQPPIPYTLLPAGYYSSHLFSIIPNPSLSSAISRSSHPANTRLSSPHNRTHNPELVLYGSYMSSVENVVHYYFIYLFCLLNSCNGFLYACLATPQCGTLPPSSYCTPSASLTPEAAELSWATLGQSSHDIKQKVRIFIIGLRPLEMPFYNLTPNATHVPRVPYDVPTTHPHHVTVEWLAVYANRTVQATLLQRVILPTSRQYKNAPFRKYFIGDHKDCSIGETPSNRLRSQIVFQIELPSSFSPTLQCNNSVQVNLIQLLHWTELNLTTRLYCYFAPVIPSGGNFYFCSERNQKLKFGLWMAPLKPTTNEMKLVRLTKLKRITILIIKDLTLF